MGDQWPELLGYFLQSISGPQQQAPHPIVHMGTLPPLFPKYQGYCISQRVPVCLSPVQSVAKLSGRDRQSSTLHQ